MQSNQEDTIIQTINQYLKAQEKNHNLCGSVLIAKKGAIVFQENFGMASLEKSVPNTSKTKHEIASVTKQFTAMAIMQLQEKGLLNINDHITKYIPDYSPSNATIYNLLTHTSGIPEFHGQSSKTYNSLDEIIAEHKTTPLESDPGKIFCYCNCYETCFYSLYRRGI